MHLRQLLLVSMTIGALLSSIDLRVAIAGEEESPATPPTPPPAAPPTPPPAAPPAAPPKTPGDGFFKELGFGVGVSYTQTFGKDRINSAQIVDGTVRIDDERNSIPRIMLETHYFFMQEDDFKFLGLAKVKKTAKKWGVGPFVAVQPGTNQIIEAISAGVMWGFRYTDDPTDTRSWNIALGLSVEPSSKTLGDGFVKNHGAPAGETEVRYQNRTLMGVTALVSFGW